MSYNAPPPPQPYSGSPVPSYETPQQPAPAPAGRKRRRWLVPAVAAAVLLIGGMVAGGVAWASREPEKARALSAWDLEQMRTTDLQRAKFSCAPRDIAVEVADEGNTMLIDGRGETVGNFIGADIAVTACVLGKLEAPKAVIAHMDSTRALDGRQEDSWTGYTASWSYHPDNGLDLIIRTG